MKAEKFQHEVIGTSRTFYRNQGLQVRIEGDQAKTDGQTVFLPALDMSKDVDIQRQMIMRGYIDHEAGHGRHTDMKAWSESGHKIGRLKYAPILANAIEDIRIEKLVAEEYPGSQKNLEAVADAVNKKYLRDHAKTPGIGKNFAKIGAIALTWEGRRRAGYAVKTNEECLKTLDPDVRKKVERLCDLAEKCTSTKDAIQLAVTIDREIEDELKGGGGGGSGSGGGGAGGSGVGRSGGAREATKDVGFGEDHTAMISADPAEVVREAAGGASSTKGYGVWTWDRDYFVHVKDVPRKARFTSWKKAVEAHGLANYERAINATKGATSQMRRKLERALITKQNRGWKRNQEEGNLDSRRLAAALAGETRVHRVREDVDDMDVAVMLVVDMSGSMNNAKIRIAQQSAICYAEALDKVGIPFAVTGFTNHYDEALNPLESARGYATHYRNYPLDLYIFKTFDETLKQAKPAMGGIISASMADNADGDCLLQLYWKYLKGRDEKRKVMIVFSDGHPAAGGGDQAQRLRNVTKYLMEDEKIELFGLGIMSDAPKHFYPKWAIVNDIEDLTKEALNILARTLIDPNFKVDNRELMKVDEKVRR